VCSSFFLEWTTGKRKRKEKRRRILLFSFAFFLLLCRVRTNEQRIYPRLVSFVLLISSKPFDFFFLFLSLALLLLGEGYGLNQSSKSFCIVSLEYFCKRQQESMGCGWQNHWVFVSNCSSKENMRGLFLWRTTQLPLLFSPGIDLFITKWIKHVLETWARQWLRTMMYTSSSTGVVQSLQAKAPNLVLS
jgi:hypothetical protein